jgi:hypothetical protein
MKTSAPLGSTTNPNPFLQSNHFTVPTGIQTPRRGPNARGPEQPGPACRTATHVWRTHRTVVRDRTLRESSACVAENERNTNKEGGSLSFSHQGRIARPAPSSKKNPPQKPWAFAAGYLIHE